MALIASALKALIISEFQNWDGTSGAQPVLTKMGQIYADYIKDNADLNYTWVAFLPPPPSTPDPMTTATGKIQTLTFNLTPSNATTKAAAHAHFKAEMIAGMTAATHQITGVGFITTGTMAMGAGLASLDIESAVNNLTTPDAAITALCTEIIRWVKSLSGAIVNGTHLTYTVGGVGTVSSIN